MWLQHPIQLAGKIVRLEPLGEVHIPGLLNICSGPNIWLNLPIDGSDAEKLRVELGNAIINRAMGNNYPFAIIRQSDNKIIGSTRLFDIFPEHKKLEIGWTWFGEEFWGKGYNIECKYLLLKYCFETLGCNRVQLKTREANIRSQRAITKIGAELEGMLRNDRIMPDGEIKHTLIYSIIKEDWPVVKERLEGMVGGSR
ncbi:MAG: GNAT family protein [Chitinophagaceae bacterium]